ncbi:sigma-70 family RNA polymerase sigma factor [bacterium]|nr:MAG: sigma-70 family RNA polymerase sigma factor [bacterium]
MKAAQAGDQASYARLLREIAPLLRQLARRAWPTGSHVDIEDIVQETLLTLHVIRHTYDAGRPFMPWLLALLRRRTADRVRQYARVRLREIQMEALDVTFSSDPAKIEYESPVDGEVLRRAVAHLPPGQRQAIELLKLKELSLKQVSEATGVSIAALKVATHRALTALRMILNTPK